MNLPKAAHVASAAPPAARFGSHVDFQTEAATRFALGGIHRGEKVLLIGSRWQYRDILRRLEDVGGDLRRRGGKLSWRNRDIAVFETDELQDELLVDNMPSGARFESFVERACETVRGSRRVRVWNNLGARLHDSGHPRACRAIERLWHQTQQDLGYTILCSYALPDDAPDAAFGDLKRPLNSHTHIVHAGQGSVVVELVHSRRD